MVEGLPIKSNSGSWNRLVAIFIECGSEAREAYLEAESQISIYTVKRMNLEDNIRKWEILVLQIMPIFFAKLRE